MIAWFQVIVTSYLFPSAKFDLERLRKLSEKVEKRRLVVDVRSVSAPLPIAASVTHGAPSSSCRRREDRWVVAMNRWQDLTDMDVNEGASADPSGMIQATILSAVRLAASLSLLSDYSRFIRSCYFFLYGLSLTPSLPSASF